MKTHPGNLKQHQCGLSMAELMIGIAVGLIVIGIVGTLFITTLRGSDDTLRSMKLNQELRAAMDYMVADIRRSGFWARAATPPTANPPYDNPYTVRGGAATDVYVAKNCVMYSYDNPNNTVAPFAAPLRYAFRRIVAANGNGVVQMPQSNVLGTGTDDACAEGNWEALTDPNTVTVTQLDFSFEGSRCENLDSDSDAGTPGIQPRSWQITAASANQTQTIPACANTTAVGYVAPKVGDRLVEMRQVRIQLAGQHAKDPNVTLTLDESIKIPNNRALLAP
jgi:type IV pilus assembly protein PilW